MTKIKVKRSAPALLLLALIFQLQAVGVSTATPVRQASPADPATPAQDSSVATYFPQTGHNLALGFRAYWQQHGGQAAFGLPISEEFRQVNATDGKEYTVQYFELARFEYHPEIADPNYQVSLGFLGREAESHAEISSAVVANSRAGAYFPQTSHNLTAPFLQYWQQSGGLNRFGYPISEQLQDSNGRTVQYFERAEFVYYSELASTNDAVQLADLGYDSLVDSGVAAPSGALVEMLPPTLAEGDTMLVRINAAPGATISSSFDGRTLPWLRDDNPPHAGYWTLLGAEAMDSVGSHKLTLTITEPNGTVRNLSRDVQVYARNFPTQDLPIGSDLQSLLSPEQEARETAAMNAASDDTVAQQLWQGEFLTPLRHYTVTTEFGQRRGYNGAPPTTYHAGIDMAAPQGTIVSAAANGRVVFAGTVPERGNCIVLDHGLGVHTVYGHLSYIGVNMGDTVTRGQFIGRVGSTGFSTGPHLHWEVRVGRTPVDPNQWVNIDYPLED